VTSFLPLSLTVLEHFLYAKDSAISDVLGSQSPAMPVGDVSLMDRV
jgi:hypothetical protein